MNTRLERAYLRLLRKALMGAFHQKQDTGPLSEQELRQAGHALETVRQRFGQAAEQNQLPQSEEIRITLRGLTPEVAADWLRRNTRTAYTLLDPPGFTNVENCIRNILKADVPGDLIECGVWRGGTCIFMRGVLRALGDAKRRVWVADSFQGLPDPDPETCPLDAVSHEVLKLIGAFSVSLEAVRENFKQFDLLDPQVQFIPGWFSESLKQAPLGPLSLIRLDADYYDSTVPALDALYHRLSPGGYLIVDDYGIYNLGARRAVDEFRTKHSIEDPLVPVNEAIVYWQKS